MDFVFFFIVLVFEVVFSVSLGWNWMVMNSKSLLWNVNLLYVAELIIFLNNLGLWSLTLSSYFLHIIRFIFLLQFSPVLPLLVIDTSVTLGAVLFWADHIIFIHQLFILFDYLFNFGYITVVLLNHMGLNFLWWL